MVQAYLRVTFERGRPGGNPIVGELDVSRALFRWPYFRCPPTLMAHYEREYNHA
jgi:hypothetical protein